jgi:TM2 domain-containing membrane protein YozV
VNGKGKDIKNEIYNWLIIFVKCCALEDVALFYPSLFYVYGKFKAMINGRNIRTMPFI